MFLRSQKEKPVSVEMEPATEAASRHANSQQSEAAPSLNDTSMPANVNPENVPQALTEEMRRKLAAHEMLCISYKFDPKNAADLKLRIGSELI